MTLENCKKIWKDIPFEEMPQYCTPFGVDFFELGWKKCCEWFLASVEKSNSDGSMIDCVKDELGLEHEKFIPVGDLTKLNLLRDHLLKMVKYLYL